MDALALLDRLESLISESARVPLTSKVIVNEDDVYALIDDLRATIPEEVKQAKWVVRERDRLLEEARKDAEAIVKEAQSQAAKMVEESSVTAQAKVQAEEIIAQARRTAQEVRQGANEYAAAVLEKLESHLSRTIETVRSSRVDLSASIAGGTESTQKEQKER